ncbi:hypothetical protein M8J75_011845 [Diaphorina citri]|nr:hypothetical protein M8J75_011845 [Diaphorina citri]
MAVPNHSLNNILRPDQLANASSAKKKSTCEIHKTKKKIHTWERKQKHLCQALSIRITTELITVQSTQTTGTEWAK